MGGFEKQNVFLISKDFRKRSDWRLSSLSLKGTRCYGTNGSIRGGPSSQGLSFMVCC